MVQEAPVVRVGDGPSEPARLRGARSEELIAAAVAPSFASYYRDLQPEMVRLAVLLTGSRDTAQDLVQDAFVRLHRAWPRVREPHAYLRRAVVNACHSHHRHLLVVRREAARLEPPGSTAAEPDELTDALAALPHRQRAAIVLRFYADLPDADIAAALGCRPGTVASLVHRGLAQLRRVIEP